MTGDSTSTFRSERQMGGRLMSRRQSILTALSACLALACASPYDEDPDYTGMSEDDF